MPSDDPSSTTPLRADRAEIHRLELQVGLLVQHLQTELGSDGREGNIQRTLSLIRDDVHYLKGHILGDEIRVGLLVRIDRLEQDKRLRDKAVWTLIPIVAGLVLNAVWQWLG